jgi:hypothetical protein
MPERFYAVRKDSLLVLLIGLPERAESAPPLLLYGDHLWRALEEIAEEDRDRLLRGVRYELCGVTRLAMPAEEGEDSSSRSIPLPAIK